MILHFQRNGAWEIVQGKMVAPTTGKELEKFNEKLAGAHFDLLACLGGELKAFALSYENLKDAWNAVVETCSFADDVELQKVEEELENFTCQEVLSGITTLKALFHRLKAAGGTISDSQKSLKLLKALPKNYNELVMQIKTSSEYRNEDSTYNYEKVIMHIQKRAMVMKKQVVTPVKKEKVLKAAHKLKCYNCGAPGHVKARCTKCFRCKKEGHRMKDCPMNNKMSAKKSQKCSDASDEHDFRVLVARRTFGKRRENGSKSVRFCLDSAATMHCCSDKSIMQNLKQIKKPFVVETLNSTVKVEEVGEVHGNLTNGTKVILKNVAYDAKIKESFVFSTAVITNKKWQVNLTKSFADIITPEGTLFTRVMKGEASLYWLELDVRVPRKMGKKSLKSAVDWRDVWHRRFGHVGYSTLLRMARKNTVNGLPKLRYNPHDWCEACAATRISAKPIGKVTQTHKISAKRPLEKIHMDTIGPFPAGGNEKYKYILHIVDDFSKYKWAYCVTSKSAIPSVVVGFLKKIQRVSGHNVKNVKSDNGTEFVNERIKKYLASEGIQFDTSPPGVPQLNGAVERANRTLQEGLTSLLKSSKLSRWYWPYAVKCASYIQNRTGCRLLPNFLSPYEVLWDKKPIVGHFRVFGAKGFAMDGRKKQKLQQRGRPARFLGYDTAMRSYIVQWTDTNTIGTARTGKWDEFSKSSVQRSGSKHGEDLSDVEADPELRDVLDVFNYSVVSEQTDDPTVPPLTSENESEKDPGQHEEGDQATRNGITKGWCDVASTNVVTSKRISKPIERYDPSDTAKKAIVKLSKIQVPRHFGEIKYRTDANDWYTSYQKEIDSLENIGKFEVIDRSEVPEGKEILPILELFKVKPDGRKKTRIVVRGDLQSEKNLEVYSPTANAVSVRLVIALAATKGWKLRQLDVSNAYLHGRTCEPTFIELPLGHQLRDGKRKVYRTNSSTYGLKQSGKIWNQTIDDFLISVGFCSCPVEKCLYMKDDFFLIVYVDDLLYTAKDAKDVEKFEAQIKSIFSVKIEENVKKFLGFEIVENEHSVTIKQNEYVKKLIKSFGLENAKEAHVPMQPNIDLDSNNGEELVDAHLFQALLGALLYVNMQTRPDICFAINMLSRHAKHPTKTHLKLLKQVVRYLKSCPNLGLKFKRSNSVDVTLHVDSSWANGPRRRSMFGFVVNVNGTAVSFRTKMQSITALSSTEAEYIGMCSGVKELMFVRNMLEFLKVEITEPMVVYNDNQAAIKIGNDLTSVTRTKHIALRYFYMQDLVDEGTIVLAYRRTDEMVADMMTKALGRKRFTMLRDLLLEKASRQDEEGVVSEHC